MHLSFCKSSSALAQILFVLYSITSITIHHLLSRFSRWKAPTAPVEHDPEDGELSEGQADDINEPKAKKAKPNHRSGKDWKLTHSKQAEARTIKRNAEVSVDGEKNMYPQAPLEGDAPPTYLNAPNDRRIIVPGSAANGGHDAARSLNTVRPHNNPVPPHVNTIPPHVNTAPPHINNVSPHVNNSAVAVTQGSRGPSTFPEITNAHLTALFNNLPKPPINIGKYPRIPPASHNNGTPVVEKSAVEKPAVEKPTLKKPTDTTTAIAKPIDAKSTTIASLLNDIENSTMEYKIGQRAIEVEQLNNKIARLEHENAQLKEANWQLQGFAGWAKRTFAGLQDSYLKAWNVANISHSKFLAADRAAFYLRGKANAWEGEARKNLRDAKWYHEKSLKLAGYPVDGSME